jgi:hypothetical protein
LAAVGVHSVRAQDGGDANKGVPNTQVKVRLAPTLERSGVGAVPQRKFVVDPQRDVSPAAAPKAANGPIIDSGLRSLGDNNLLLFDNPDVGTLNGWAEGAEDVILIPNGVTNQAYAVEEIDVALLMHTSTTVHTFARIEFWEHDTTALFDPNCTQQDVKLAKYGRVIADLGTALSTTCNNTISSSARRKINLLTGAVTLYGDRPDTVIANGVKVNRIGAANVENRPSAGGFGSIPVGRGDVGSTSGATGLARALLENRVLVTIEFGVPNGTQTDIVDAPPDACSTLFGVPTLPGAWMLFSTVQANTSPGMYSDGFGDNDNEWECDEFFGFDGEDFAGPSLVMHGSRDTDCNTNGFVDRFDIKLGTSADINANGRPDECETRDQGGPVACAPNGVPDTCDISCSAVLPNGTPCSSFAAACGDTPDCNSDGVPDACTLTGSDCNSNGIPDDCDLAGASEDCNNNSIPDECDVDADDPDGDGLVYRNCDGDLIPDGCQRWFTDCNQNNIDDFCDIQALELNDYDSNGVPDVCQQFGQSVVLDFEFAGSTGFQYEPGRLHFQPDPTEEFSILNWATFDGDLAFLTVANVAELESGNVGPVCGGSKRARFFETNSSGLPQDEWSVFSPHIYLTNTDGFLPSENTLPLRQEISMKVKLNQTGNLDGGADARPDTGISWRIYFGSIFGGPDPTTLFVDDARVIVFFETDTSVPAMPTRLGFIDGSGGGLILTNVDWEAYLNQEVELKVVIDLSKGTSLDITNTGELWWAGTKVADFTPRFGPRSTTSTTDLLLMDKLYIDQLRNTPKKAFGGATLQVDCIKLTRDREFLSCSSFASDDCNNDGICDVYQVANGDRDDNGILDICEGFCPDCNNNSIIDTIEIAAGSAPDTNANDIIDWCERTTHATSFEAADGFVVGPIDGQRGWHETDGALSEVTSTAITGWPRQGVNYLVVKKNPDTVRNFALLFEPRQDTLGDAEIEIWSWDWGYSDLGFSQIAVEVGDLCTDIRTNGVNDGDGTGGRTPAAFFDEAEWIDIANAGVSIFCNVPNATATEVPKTRVFALQVANAVHGYLEVQGVLGANINGTFFGDKWNAAGLKIMNVRGQFDILWGRNTQTQTTMLANQGNAYSLGGTKLVTVDETRRQRPQRYASSAIIREGGDRQMVIRVARREATTLGDTDFEAIPPFGASGATQFWFDDFRYATAKDCDADGTSDATYLALNPTYDRNVDGIPDNCQDCDDDCGNFPLANNLPATLACLDPNEKVGNDCNNNGIQDSCDVNPQRPFVNKIDTAGCYPNPGGDNFLPNGQCFEARYGGGSCDLNANGTPDECEGPDCNATGCLDWAEIAAAGGTFAKCPGGSPAAARCGGTLDVDSNGIPDECQPDCNNNGKPDGPASTLNTDLNVGNTGGSGSQDSWPYFGNPLQIGDGIPDECCVVCTGLPGGYPWTDQCHSEPADGDLDRDSDVDAYDYKFVQRCASTEPARPANPYPHPKGTVVGSATGGVNWDGISCGCADLNGNGTVDQTDLGVLQAFVTGPE